MEKWLHACVLGGRFGSDLLSLLFAASGLVKFFCSSVQSFSTAMFLILINFGESGFRKYNWLVIQ